MFGRRPQGATLPTVEAGTCPTRRRSGSGMERGKKSEEHDTPLTRRRLSTTRLHNLLLGDVSSRECCLIVVLIMRCLVGVRLCPRLSGKGGRGVSTLIGTRARVGTDRVSFHFPRTRKSGSATRYEKRVVMQVGPTVCSRIRRVALQDHGTPYWLLYRLIAGVGWWPGGSRYRIVPTATSQSVPMADVRQRVCLVRGARGTRDPAR